MTKMPMRLRMDQYTPSHNAIKVFHQFLNDDVDIHYHDFNEINVVFSGRGRHFLNGHESELRPGTAFLLTPIDFHEIKILEPIECYNIIFTDTVLSKDIITEVYNCQRKCVVNFDSDCFVHIRVYCEQLWNHFCHNTSSSGLATTRLLELLLMEVSRESMTGYAAMGFDELSIQHALAFIHDHFRDDISLDDVAREAGLSTNYFSNKFHSVVGVTFQSYLQDLRLSFASNLLSMSNLTVTEVGSTAGFKSLSHFERSFRSKYCQSPKMYRSASLGSRMR